MADSYDKRAAGWNPFNLQPLQREASQASVILHRQAVGEEAETRPTGGGSEFSQARKRITLQLITPISTSLTPLNNCSDRGSTRGGVVHTGVLFIHPLTSNGFFAAFKCVVMCISYSLAWTSDWPAVLLNFFYVHVCCFFLGREGCFFVVVCPNQSLTSHKKW